MASFHFRIKSGKKGSAVDHADYISRTGRFAVKDDLVDSDAGNLPDWAQGDPRAFWRAADKYERENGASYRELVFALPGELTMEQSREVVLRYAHEVIGPRPHVWAIHCPGAAIGDCVNLHVHLMYSDRMPDGIRRSAEQTFRRHNAADPEAGGCRKASGGRNRMQLRDELIDMRRKCAAIQNEALSENGCDARVDHRTLKAQGIKRTPERRLGPTGVKRLDDSGRRALSEQRNLRAPQQDSLGAGRVAH